MPAGRSPPATAGAVVSRLGWWRRPPVRYKVRFPESEALDAAVRTDASALSMDFAVVNQKRGYVSIEVPGTGAPKFVPPQLSYYLAARAASAIQAFERGINVLQSDFGVALEPEIQYEPEPTEELEWWPFSPNDGKKMPEVFEAINAAPRDSLGTRGEGVVVAVVDTGVNAERAGIGANRRGAGFSVGGAGDPWRDAARHGTRSALIAAGDVGLAPAATVYPCRTQFYEGELTAIFDHLVETVVPILGDHRLVITNSYGFRSGTPPRVDTDFVAAINDAVAAGAVVVFSGGNYHQLAGGPPIACSPTTIWSYKCLEGVLTVAAADFEGRMQRYSSRGPGQLAGQPGTNPKPDVTAPVPRKWASSGACPQVAGLSALLLSADPGMDAQIVRSAIVASAQPMGHGHDCEGAGLIDCRRALASR